MPLLVFPMRLAPFWPPSLMKAALYPGFKPEFRLPSNLTESIVINIYICIYISYYDMYIYIYIYIYLYIEYIAFVLETTHVKYLYTYTCHTQNSTFA